MDTCSSTEYRRPLRFFFFSFPAFGHMIPLIDIAKLFSRRRGVSCTFVATPGNEYAVRPAIEGSTVDLLLLPFPPEAAPGSGMGENLATVPRSQHGRLLSALPALKDPFHDLLRAHRADCVVSDVHSSIMWIDDVALALGIPRILFVIVGVFPATVVETVATLPGAHDESVETLTIEEGIELPKAELSTFLSNPEIIHAIEEAKRRCFGVVFNTFYELEGRYVDRYRTKPGCPRRTFCVSPVFLSKTTSAAAAAAANRGGKIDSAGEECLKWLDSVEAEGSVTYVCFGSENEFGRQQLTSIALGLEASGYPFVWVVKKSLAEDIAGWLPEGFEERMEGRGLIIKGWAPQVAILNHRAVGAIVTHCGWNSTLEAISAGLPLATWPLQCDQFVTEKYVTQVLRVGVSACRGARLAEAVREVMGSGGAEMRQRVREYAAKAKEAVQEGGSSYKDVDNLIEEVGKYHAAGKQG
ncbi:scopoletin glucosyltransferase-like [Iris pallida]|uniref:Scopoletin glucosyltransferase-like n=1 Tax=Iris pallida TaxID=29817 RepID=A0AAX6I1G7_IRIPA|nr:scopoletin glucosyltransferase-like [Iris pallida]